MEYRNTKTVLLEATVIGIMTVLLYVLLKLISYQKVPVMFLLFLTGFFIHVIFEYTSGNELWCKNTYKF